MDEGTGTIHDILAREQELKERIAVVTAELAAEVAAVRAANETTCRCDEEELRREREDLLAGVADAAAVDASMAEAQAEAYAQRLADLDDATLCGVLLPLLRGLLPGRGS